MNRILQRTLLCERFGWLPSQIEAEPWHLVEETAACIRGLEAGRRART